MAKDNYDPEAWKAWKPPGEPDRAAVWIFDEFKRELLKRHPHVKVNVAAEPENAFMGLPIIVDETLLPGIVELRCGKEVISIVNFATSQ